MNEPSSLFQDVHRKLVAGTEILRTGGSTTLNGSECNAVLDALGGREQAIDKLTRETATLRMRLGIYREFYESWWERERGVCDFDLHHEQVERFRKACDRVQAMRGDT